MIVLITHLSIKQYRLTMKINTKQTTEVQFYYFKDREHQLIWYDLTHNQTHPRSYAHIHCDQAGADWFIFVDVRE